MGFESVSSRCHCHALSNWAMNRQMAGATDGGTICGFISPWKCKILIVYPILSRLPFYLCTLHHLLIRIDDHPSYFWPCIYLKPVLSGINNDFEFFLMNTVKLRVMAKFKKVQKVQDFFYFPPILRNLYCFLFPVTLPLCSLNLVLIYTLDQELCYQNLFTPLLIC